jgi:hypothetical protein
MLFLTVLLLASLPCDDDDDDDFVLTRFFFLASFPNPQTFSHRDAWSR